MSDVDDPNGILLRGPWAGDSYTPPPMPDYADTNPPPQNIRSAPPEAPEETTMELPPIPAAPDPATALRSEGITAPETDENDDEYEEGEYRQPRSLADRLGDWLEFRLERARAAHESEVPFREAEVARKAALLEGRTAQEVAMMEHNGKLQAAMMKAKGDKAAARGKADAERARASGLGSDSGRSKSGGGAGPSRGGGGTGAGPRGGQGRGGPNSTDRGDRSGARPTGAGTGKGGGKGPERSPDGRKGPAGPKESPKAPKGRQDGSGGSGGSGKGGGAGSPGKNGGPGTGGKAGGSGGGTKGNGSGGGGKGGSKGGDGPSQRNTSGAAGGEWARGRQERASARQAARLERRRTRQDAGLADRTRDRDQDRANRQTTWEERRKAKAERAARKEQAKQDRKDRKDREAGEARSKGEDVDPGRVTLGEALMQEAQRRWGERREAEKDEAAKAKAAKDSEKGEAGDEAKETTDDETPAAEPKVDLTKDEDKDGSAPEEGVEATAATSSGPEKVNLSKDKGGKTKETPKKDPDGASDTSEAPASGNGPEEAGKAAGGPTEGPEKKAGVGAEDAAYSPPSDSGNAYRQYQQFDPPHDPRHEAPFDGYEETTPPRGWQAGQDAWSEFWTKRRAQRERLRDWWKATWARQETPRDEPGTFKTAEGAAKSVPPNMAWTWVGREDRTPRRPPQAQADEDYPEAEIVGPAALPRAPEPHTQRPGTSRPTAKENTVSDQPAARVGKARASSKPGQAGLAAEHRTDITFGEYLVEIANIALGASEVKESAEATANELGKVVGALKDMATDLMGHHNIATEVTNQLADMADDARRTKAQTERAAGECALAAETAQTAAVSVARTYSEDLNAMDAGGVTYASSAAHHD
ncbi:ATP/GTP-binding protein [Streptomyces sp. NPDC093097]|uniref:ATP/GTP-binding protein n=1 Tax=Streptomyces sp. NPDC093097 TaxID=3366027 RepID=UPI0038081D6F